MRARIEQNNRDYAYMIYMTDTAKAITGNTARVASGGQEITKRWIDVVDRKPADTRTGDEIALEVIKAAGLSFAGNSETGNSEKEGGE